MAFEGVRTAGNRKSSQLHINTSDAEAATPGAVVGRVILNNTYAPEHPSIRAASSTLYGTLSKNDFAIHTAKGTFVYFFSSPS